MNVYAPSGRLSWKIAVPVILLLAGSTIGLWILPEIPGLDKSVLPLFRLLWELVRGLLTIVRWMTMVLMPFAIFGVLSWAIWGNKYG